MFNLTDMIISRRIQVRLETVSLGALVVDLVLEKQHIIAAQLLQNVSDPRTAEQLQEFRMVVGKLFGAHELTLTVGIDFIIRHPFTPFTRPLSNVVGPSLEIRWPDKLVLGRTKDEVSLRVIMIDLILRQ